MSLLDELAQVRAEIKTWERTFRTENGRDPSRDDIKAVPEISKSMILQSCELSYQISFLAS